MFLSLSASCLSSSTRSGVQEFSAPIGWRTIIPEHALELQKTEHEHGLDIMCTEQLVHNTPCAPCRLVRKTVCTPLLVCMCVIVIAFVFVFYLCFVCVLVSVVCLSSVPVCLFPTE